jgi:uncharacterized protein with ParB-like and HNH nuclease domain
MTETRESKTKQQLGGILAKQLSIPEFQREYSWKEHQCIDFLNDIVDNLDKIKTSRKYFFGPMIWSGDSSDEKFLIDGQQRIITSWIFLNLLYDIKKEFFSNSKKEFFVQSNENAIFVKNYDKSTYSKISSEKNPDTKIEELKEMNKKNVKMASAYEILYDKVYDEIQKKFFVKQISDFKEEIKKLDQNKEKLEEQRTLYIEQIDDLGNQINMAKGERKKELQSEKKNIRLEKKELNKKLKEKREKIKLIKPKIENFENWDDLEESIEENIGDFLKDLEESLLNFQVYVIDSKPYDVFEVFESLNQRGIVLTQSELVRNYCIQHEFEGIDYNLDSKSKNFTKFEECLENIDNTNKERDEFLLHFCRKTFLDDFDKLKGTESIFRIIKKNITTKDETKQFLDKLQIFHDIYVELRGNTFSNKLRISEYSEGYNTLVGTQRLLYPMIIYAIENNISKKDIEKLLKICMVINFRYISVMNGSPNQLGKIMFKILKNFEQKVIDGQSIEIDEDIIKIFSAIYPSTSEIIKSFKDDPNNLKHERYVLKTIFQEMENYKKTSVDIIIKKWDVEHIIPQSVLEGKGSNYDKWKRFFDKKKIKYKNKKVLESIVKRWGNLAFLQYKDNRKLKDAFFTEKKANFADKSVILIKKIKEPSIKNMENRESVYGALSARYWNIVELEEKGSDEQITTILKKFLKSR